jgi:hypothetical protein
MSQRGLTEDENRELAALNDAVSAAIAARRTWLDAKMHECSDLQVGDDIYDLGSGSRLGRVSKLYRYWADRDDGIRDTSVSCNYEYETGRGCFDNTSRQSGRSFGTQDEAVQRAVGRAYRLRDELLSVREMEQR